MTETENPLKRLREETQVEEEEEKKRQRPYHDLLSILEDEEEEPHQDDLSSLITTLQQELSSSEPDHYPSSLPKTTTATPLETGPMEPPSTTANTEDTSSLSPLVIKEEGEQKGSTIIRHLLEASDDELGIPKANQMRLQTKFEDEDIILGGEIYSGGSSNIGESNSTAVSLFDFPDGFWDFEDFDHQSAQYCTLSQSDFFM